MRGQPPPCNEGVTKGPGFNSHLLATVTSGQALLLSYHLPYAHRGWQCLDSRARHGIHDLYCHQTQAWAAALPTGSTKGCPVSIKSQSNSKEEAACGPRSLLCGIVTGEEVTHQESTGTQSLIQEMLDNELCHRARAAGFDDDLGTTQTTSEAYEPLQAMKMKLQGQP